MGARLALTAVAMVGVLVVAACEGENLFSVPGGPGTAPGVDAKAPVVTITIPRGDSLSAKPLGDSVFVSTHVTDNVGIESVRMYGIALRGDPSLGTDEVVDRFAEKTITLREGLRDTTLTRYLIPTSDSTKETALIVVEASDSSGNVSADTVNLILGGPDVELLDIVGGQSIQAGLNLTARVRARDPLGIINVRIEVRGAFEATVSKSITPPQDSVVVDTLIPIPAGAVGAITVTAIARNNLDVAGQDGPLTLNVISSGLGDTIAPRLKHVATAPTRMELQDSVTITITGSDNSQGSGVAAAGYTVLGISPSRGDTLVRSGQRTFDPPRTGTITTSFTVGTFNVDSLTLPDTLVYEVTTWMRDADGNCSAAVGSDSLAALPCGARPGGQTIAQGRTGQRLLRSVVAGKTVRLPSGGKVLDAVVDTSRLSLLLSNISRNRIEVFRLDSETFGTAIGVGAAPWGLSLNNCAPLSPTAGCGDTLIVANSGGTNLSNVYLGPKGSSTLAGAGEDNNRRLLTPDVALFDVEIQESNEGGLISYDVTHHPIPDALGFSDRPQYVARDSTGRILYSTRVVEELDQVGTIRKAELRPGYLVPEVKIFLEHAELTKSENFTAIGHVDAIGEGNEVTIVDHVPGDPTNTISATGDILDAPADLAALGSDIYWVNGAKWDVSNVGFQDTTFVTASGDGGWVAFGEGGADPVGRVIMYNAETDDISRWVEVTDLMTNAGESVRGLGLNYDGTMGAVRGRREVGFFTTDLRLQGSALLEVSGGSGAVLHPLHSDYPSLTNSGGTYQPDTHLAFVGTDAQTIEIWDTFKFTRVGRIYIRDNIVGPLKASLPFPSDNLDADGNPLKCVFKPVVDQVDRQIGQAVEIYKNGVFETPWGEDGGGAGSEDSCVVLKLYGTTTAGGVVVIDVRKSDVLRDHPAR